MHLKHQVGDPLQRSVGTERGNDVVGRSNVGIECRDHLSDRVSGRQVTAGEKMRQCAPQSGLGETKSLLATVGSKDTA